MAGTVGIPARAGSDQHHGRGPGATPHRRAGLSHSREPNADLSRPSPVFSETGTTERGASASVITRSGPRTDATSLAAGTAAQTPVPSRRGSDPSERLEASPAGRAVIGCNGGGLRDQARQQARLIRSGAVGELTQADVERMAEDITGAARARLDAAALPCQRPSADQERQATRREAAQIMAATAPGCRRTAQGVYGRIGQTGRLIPRDRCAAPAEVQAYRAD